MNIGIQTETIQQALSSRVIESTVKAPSTLYQGILNQIQGKDQMNNSVAFD